jgi:GH15 family glucan-1,4-alpha-glucosidase
VGRDLYQQAMGLIAAGDAAQPLRMGQFMWNTQFDDGDWPLNSSHRSVVLGPDVWIWFAVT